MEKAFSCLVSFISFENISFQSGGQKNNESCLLYCVHVCHYSYVWLYALVCLDVTAFILHLFNTQMRTVSQEENVTVMRSISQSLNHIVECICVGTLSWVTYSYRLHYDTLHRQQIKIFNQERKFQVSISVCRKSLPLNLGVPCLPAYLKSPPPGEGTMWVPCPSEIIKELK